MEAAEQGPIPSWWKEVPDPAGGGVYYWNELTNETSWERPQAAAPSKSGPGPSSEPQLPAGWRKVRVQLDHEPQQTGTSFLSRSFPIGTRFIMKPRAK